MMQRRLFLALAPASLLARRVQAQPAPEILARFPHGTFLENLVVMPDGLALGTGGLTSGGQGEAVLARIRLSLRAPPPCQPRLRPPPSSRRISP